MRDLGSLLFYAQLPLSTEVRVNVPKGYLHFHISRIAKAQVVGTLDSQGKCFLCRVQFIRD